MGRKFLRFAGNKCHTTSCKNLINNPKMKNKIATSHTVKKYINSYPEHNGLVLLKFILSHNVNFQWLLSKFTLLIYACILFSLTACNKREYSAIKNSHFSISWTTSSVSSWKYTVNSSGKSLEFKLPVFEINGIQTPVILNNLSRVGAPVKLRNGSTEYIFEGSCKEDSSVHLQLNLRISDDNPVVRFKYSLKAPDEYKLTKAAGKDNLKYFSYPAGDFQEIKEISLSVFNEMIHSCILTETSIYNKDFINSARVIGPIIIGSNTKLTFLSAYEHDSMYPDNFLEYRFSPDKSVNLSAVKGNYYEGQAVNGYSSIWFEIAGIEGDEAKMAEHFRRFILGCQSEALESRKPYIYYNTWGRQERIKWAGGTYLSTMNLDYTLSEIDRAHEMGLEVYVLDAGWFDKTGDWGVNLKNFPDGFKQVKERLKEYDMKLGIWLDPAKAAITSTAMEENKDCQRTWNGVKGSPSPVWETEESVNMCIVSPFWETFADKLIGLYKELNVRYFYFDGVGQYGCNDPEHFHGTKTNTAEERSLSYGFLMPVYLGKIMERVIAVCPEAIFDFDVTESRRIGLGLQFLANGRYFILNNGPYFHNFDLCPRGTSILPNGCRNIFINPGPARGWFMRSVLDYDKWIPSNLFLVNHLADDPKDSQYMNLGTLILGQNSVWGEILSTSNEGVVLFHDILGKYKQIRDDVTIAQSIRTGRPGDTPEIFEKINPDNGRGVVVIFSNSKGNFPYITKNKVSQTYWHNEYSNVKISNSGHAIIQAEFTEASAALVFFGTE